MGAAVGRYEPSALRRRRGGDVAGRMSGLFDGEESGTLDLTVQNDRADPITADVTVVDDEGTTYEEATERIDGGGARVFGSPLGRRGVTR